MFETSLIGTLSQFAKIIKISEDTMLSQQFELLQMNPHLLSNNLGFYIEKAISASCQGMVLQLRGCQMGKGWQNPLLKN